MWKNLARHNKLENLHSNDEWTVANDREELPYVFQLLILSTPISRKGKTKIKDRWRLTFWIFNHVLHLQFLVQFIIYAPFDWSISVTWYIILPVVWLMKSFNAYFSSSTSSSRNLPSCKYLWHISFLSEQFAYDNYLKVRLSWMTYKFVTNKIRFLYQINALVRSKNTPIV